MLPTNLHICSFQTRPILKPTNLGPLRKFDFSDFAILYFASEKCEMSLMYVVTIEAIPRFVGFEIGLVWKLRMSRTLCNIALARIFFLCWVLAPDQGALLARAYSLKCFKLFSLAFPFVQLHLAYCFSKTSFLKVIDGDVFEAKRSQGGYLLHYLFRKKSLRSIF